MRKICYVVNSLRNSGPVIVLLDIVRNLNFNEFKPYIIVLREENIENSRIEEFDRLGCEIVQFHFSLLELELKTSICSNSLKKYITENNIEIVHLHGYHPVIVAKDITKIVKTVVTFHNICGQDFLRAKGVFLGSYMVLRYLKCVRKCDCLVGISNYTSSYYERKLKRKVETIPNGVDFEKFSVCSENDKEDLRKVFGVPLDAQVYTIVGVIKKVKNIPFIIECIRKIDTSDKYFIFVGDGPLLEKSKKMAQDLKNVRFMGKRNDVEKILQLSDFSISASKSEGFGLAAVEALITGNTLFYSDIPTYKELFFSIDDLKKFMFTTKYHSSLCLLLNESKKVENYDFIREILYSKYSNTIMAKKYQLIYSNLY